MSLRRRAIKSEHAPVRSKKRQAVPHKIEPGTRRESGNGGTLSCLVLVANDTEWVGVDLSTGALVRNERNGDERSVLLATHAGDVVAIGLRTTGEPPNPSRPEAIAVQSVDVLERRVRNRARRKLLRLLQAPESPTTPILGTRGPSIAYVDLDGRSPSIVIVDASACALEVMTEGNDVVAALTWAGTTQTLPVIDPTICQAANAVAPRSLRGSALTQALGTKAGHVVVGLTAVRDGHVKKVILAVIGR